MRAAEPEQLITWSVGAWAVIVIHGGHEAHRGAVGWILEVRFGDLELNLIAGGGARSGREPVGRAGAERRVARFIVATGAVGGEHILAFEIDIRSAEVLGVVTVEENFDTVIQPCTAVFGTRCGVGLVVDDLIIDHIHGHVNGVCGVNDPPIVVQGFLRKGILTRTTEIPQANRTAEVDFIRAGIFRGIDYSVHNWSGANDGSGVGARAEQEIAVGHRLMSFTNPEHLA